MSAESSDSRLHTSIHDMCGKRNIGGKAVILLQGTSAWHGGRRMRRRESRGSPLSSKVDAAGGPPIEQAWQGHGCMAEVHRR